MKQSTWLQRCAVMAAFLLLTNTFTALHLLRCFSVERHWLFLLGYAGIFLVLVLCFRRIRTAAPYPIRCLGAYGMCLYITLTMASALCFFLPLPGWATPAAALALALWGVLHAGRIRVKRYAAPILDKSMRLILISDVHLGAVGSEERLPRLIRRINSERPDIVCIAGDLIDNSYCAIRDPERAAVLLRGIEAPLGVYACLGNHDAGETAADMQRFMARAGVRVLKEEYAAVGSLQLLGRLDASPHGDYGGEERRETEALLRENPRPELPLIVLDHKPSTIPQYDSRAALLLCGHTHNGQIFPGNLVVQAINICGYGYYKKDSSAPHVVVSSGAGAWGPPMRIGTDCEIVVIELGQ